MKDDIKQNIKERKTWLRGLYMLLFLVLYSIAKVVIFSVIALQFILTLFTGKTNERLIKLGQSLCTYLYQIAMFLTFNSNEHPYPFGAWPSGAPAAKRKAKKIESKKVDDKTEDETKEQ